MLVVKNPPAKCRRNKRHGFNPWVGKIPWQRKGQLIRVFLPGKSMDRGLQSMGGHKELDMTEWLNWTDGVLTARILKWFAIPFSVDHILSDLSSMTRPSWVAPWAWLSFIELDKAVVLVWLDWLVSCECGFSVSALWCSLATPTVLFGFILP